MEVSRPPDDPWVSTAPPPMPTPTLRLAGDAATISLSIRPTPLLTRVVHFKVFRWTVTAVMRHWRPGESGPSGQCRLCPRCTAYEDGCLKVVAGMVSRDAAALLDTTSAARQSPVTA